MYEYLKNITEKNSCRLGGVCSVHPSINALYRVIINEIKEVSFYLVKLKDFGIANKDIAAFLIEALSVFLINTNFNKTNYLAFVKKLYDLKKETREKYAKRCKENGISGEIIDSKFEIKNTTTITELIELSQSKDKDNQTKNKDKSGLFGLVTVFSRIAALNIVKIKKLKPEFDFFDYDIIKFLTLNNTYPLSNEKLKRKIKEFSQTLSKIKTELFNAETEKYGKCESSKIKTFLSKGHGILVSGDDLFDLENLLKALESSNTKETINVYTNGPLLKAHFYPYFKNNRFLKGHLGLNNAEYDFSNFPGVILITRNFIQKIDGLYRGEIFSNKIISFEKVIDIKNDDFMPAVNSALKLKPVEKEQKESFLTFYYDNPEIEKTSENSDKKEFVFVFGGENIKFDNLSDKKIFHPKLPLKTDDFIKSIEKAIKSDIKITLFFAQCDLSVFEIILCLLDKTGKEVDFYLASCPFSLVNPHIIQSLKDNFNITMI